MGGKASNNLQSNRPESGGADKDMQREKSGLLDRDKETFAVDEHEKRAGEASAQRESSERGQPDFPSTFSIDNPRNPDPNSK
ncbi:MAG TPA: hypothetical protein VM033_06700 [Gemmatimonadaceae bacterium]|nr:hypothetical protein [Gemmatimonadaceae bacterium]